ncbi:hypothetical protein MJT46_003391 [Ovis ammon polii x Ovis aries]|nr:hypothetical protein MJT46_003391 [Ovis ammon polii x Ovis aries]
MGLKGSPTHSHSVPNIPTGSPIDLQAFKSRDVRIQGSLENQTQTLYPDSQDQVEIRGAARDFTAFANKGLGQSTSDFDNNVQRVNSSAFSPDGQRLLTASEDGCVYGWETQSGRLLWRLRGHKGPVRFCRFSPDGRLFASTSCDRTVRLWDAADAKCLQVLKGHQRSVETVSFSHDSKQLASGGWDKRVMLWEVQVKVWDCNTGKCTETLKGVLNVAHACAFMPDGKLLVSGAVD